MYGRISAEFRPKIHDRQRGRKNYVTTSTIDELAKRHESVTAAEMTTDRCPR
jgi:hypothetical protein